MLPGVLNETALRTAAPSIFAEDPAARVSDRYTQIATIDIVRALAKEDYFPVTAGQQKLRDPNSPRQGYQKHLIRFRHADEIEAVARGDSSVTEVFDVVLRNSHDGRGGPYLLDLGTFRMVCANMSVIANETVRTVRVQHRGNIVNNVIEGTYEVVKDVPLVEQQIDQWKCLQLLPEQQIEFAEKALAIRYPDPVNSGFAPSQIVSPRRWEDAQDQSLWTVYNRTQEHLMRGGIHGTKQNALGRTLNVSARAIRGIDRGIELNKALWNLATETAALLH